jgi:hypothetical protein
MSAFDRRRSPLTIKPDTARGVRWNWNGTKGWSPSIEPRDRPAKPRQQRPLKTRNKNPASPSSGPSLVDKSLPPSIGKHPPRQRNPSRLSRHSRRGHPNPLRNLGRNLPRRTLHRRRRAQPAPPPQPEAAPPETTPATAESTLPHAGSASEPARSTKPPSPHPAPGA